MANHLSAVQSSQLRTGPGRLIYLGRCLEQSMQHSVWTTQRSAKAEHMQGHHTGRAAPPTGHTPARLNMLALTMAVGSLWKVLHGHPGGLRKTHLGQVGP